MPAIIALASASWVEPPCRATPKAAHHLLQPQPVGMGKGRCRPISGIQAELTPTVRRSDRTIHCGHISKHSSAGPRVPRDRSCDAAP